MAASLPSLEALLLGILQGLTEFLPVSSSAHLILIPWFFRWNHPILDSLTFDVALHAGTLVALRAYFWRDWVGLIGAFLRIVMRRRIDGFQEKLIVYLILATIPAAIAGLLLEKTIESSFRSPMLILVPLIAVSFFMILVEKRKNPRRPLNRLSLKDALIIGCAQALALVPGVSRSGITISTGLLQGYDREGAMRFSFLLSTPAIGGAALLHLRHLFTDKGTDWALFGLGFAASAIVGFLAIAFLMRYLRRHTLNLFAGYRLALAALVILGIFWIG
jgi:undecaprenyl-diphosphatase